VGRPPRFAPCARGPSQPLTIGIQERTSYDSNPRAGGTAANAEIRGLARAPDVIYSPSITVTLRLAEPAAGLAAKRLTLDTTTNQRTAPLAVSQIDLSAVRQ